MFLKVVGIRISIDNDNDNDMCRDATCFDTQTSLEWPYFYSLAVTLIYAAELAAVVDHVLIES